MTNDQTQPEASEVVDEGRACTEFVRHSTGGKSVEVIHRWGCGSVKRIKSPQPWDWAEGRPVSAWVNLPWFKPCSKCCADLIPPRRDTDE